MIIDNPNPSLGDSCIPIAKIRSVLELLKTDDLKPDEDLVIEIDTAVGIWHTLWESVQEIQMIIRHCEDQEYAEVKARNEAQEALDKKIADIRSRRMSYAN